MYNDYDDGPLEFRLGEWLRNFHIHNFDTDILLDTKDGKDNLKLYVDTKYS